MFREKTAHIHTPTLAYSAPALAEAFTFGLALALDALALPCASGHVCRLYHIEMPRSQHTATYLATLCGSWWHDPFHHFPCLGFDFGHCFCFRCSSLFFDTKRTEPIPFRHLVMEINRNPNNPIGPFQILPVDWNEEFHSSTNSGPKLRDGVASQPIHASNPWQKNSQPPHQTCWWRYVKIYHTQAFCKGGSKHLRWIVPAQDLQKFSQINSSLVKELKNSLTRLEGSVFKSAKILLPISSLSSWHMSTNFQDLQVSEACFKEMSTHSTKH